MKKLFRIIFSVLLILSVFGGGLLVSAEIPFSKSVKEDPVYFSYNYTKYQNEYYVALSPDAYTVTNLIDSGTLGTELKNPVDIYVDDNNVLYIVDCENSRILCIDSEKVSIIDGFINEGVSDVFKNPEGICVKSGKIYIADTGNKRIVILNKDLTLRNILNKPKSEAIAADLNFTPKKIDVDSNGRIYTVINGAYEGIMQLYEDNSFGGYIGTIPVETNPFLVIWKKLMSKEQRSKLMNTIPVEYTNLSVTDEGFIYAVSLKTDSSDPISLLNSKGKNVINDNSLGDIPIEGDVGVDDIALADICYDEDGLFYALDSDSGRVFAYDKTGNMLFMLGGYDSAQAGTFSSASSISILNGKILVADATRGTVTAFERTKYADDIVSAINLYNSEDYEGSIEKWNAVLGYNNNYSLAYSKIGSALYRQQKYKEAMDYFEKANDQKNYSKAFEKHRTNVFQENFAIIVIGLIIALVLLIAIFHFIGKYKKKHPALRGSKREAIEYPLYLILHPFDAFWDLKYEKRGRVWISTALYVLTIISFAVERGLTGFSLISNPDHQVDILFELKFVLLPLALFIVANLSITTFLNGKGTFKQIYTALGYALTPIVLTKIPLTIISNFLTLNEQAVYSIISVVVYLWVAILIFAMLSCTHEYTAGQTIASILLTVIAMAIICFICVLFFALCEKIFGLVYSVIKEIQVNFS